MTGAEPLGWGKCPMGCGPITGTVHACSRAGRFGEGIAIRLLPHVFALRPSLGICIGTGQPARPLPLAAPAGAEAAAQAAAVAAAAPATLF